jgi:hypothetical protein
LFIFQAKKYSTDNEFFTLYGISQNPITNDYILVQNSSFIQIYKDCINYQCQISGNKKIDDFIQEKQLMIKDSNDIIFEWIPYNQFNDINKTDKNDLIMVYSAIWKDGPLHYSNLNDNYERNSNKQVTLKYLHNLTGSTEFVINEV